ncbi:MAG: DUF2723 domain-containing protein [Gemmatimonadetes bacterium]|nr:DUF2723 domain-containing protein [Gemmatimonadota bacterium]
MIATRHSPALFGLGFAAIYLSCLGARIYLGDSGELVAAAHTLDIPHPPGYPLWLLLARLFDMLPFATSAWKVALLSAVAGAAALEVLHRAAIRFATPGASFAALALLGTSPLYWEQAVLPEVYALHSLLFALVLWALLPDAEGRNTPLAGYGAALATIAHPLGAGTWILVALRAGVKRTLLFAIPAGLVAFTILFVLMVRSQQDPFVNWGEPNTIARLFEHVTRSQYGIVARPAFSWELLVRNASDLARELTRASALLLLLPLAAAGLSAGAAAGATAGAKAGAKADGPRIPRRLFLTGIALYGPVLVLLLRFPPTLRETQTNAVFFTPFLILLAITAAAGIDRLALFLGRAGRFAPALFLLIALLGALRDIPAHRMRDVRLPEMYAREVLSTLPDSARLYAAGDDLLFPLLYLQRCEDFRTDVSIRNPEGTVYFYPAFEPPCYSNAPMGVPSPDGLVFRTLEAPDAKAADVLDPRPERARIERDDHLRTLWVNYFETLTQSTTDPERAVRFREEALALQEPGVAYGESFARATVLGDRGDVAGALAVLEPRPGETTSRTPRETLLEIELRLLAIGNGRAGAELFAPLGAADSWGRTERIWAARLFAMAGQSGRAEELLQSALADDPYDEDALRLALRLAERDGDARAVARLAARILQVRPGDESVRAGTAAP